MDDKRGRKGTRDVETKREIEVEGFELPESDLGPEHCPNCGGLDFFELQECGEVREVCVDCGRRVIGLA